MTKRKLVKKLHQKPQQYRKLICQQCGGEFEGVRAKFCKPCGGGLRSYKNYYRS